jgi:Fe-Mn family superoxide dismutase
LILRIDLKRIIFMAYTLPALPYAYDALEPNIDAKTMEIHHTKHHQTYINNINAAIEGTAWEKLAVEELVSKVNEVPADIKNVVINNGGGHANHSLFWTVMSPQGGGNPTGAVATAIEQELGGLMHLKRPLPKQRLVVLGVVGHGSASPLRKTL